MLVQSYFSTLRRISNTYITNRFTSNEEGSHLKKIFNRRSYSSLEPLYTRPPDLSYEIFSSKNAFQTELGGVLHEVNVAYETWGKLNADKSNAILLHTGLSASSHAASHPENTAKGWWEKFIGPGRAIDTDQFFVICCNVLGGCYGSTGPSSINPVTGKRYACSFPTITVPDMIEAQFLLVDALGIDRLYASVGASLGGMQSLCVGALKSDRVDRVVSISACARTAPSSIAMRYSQRCVLMSDPKWNNGDYYDSEYPYEGMRLSRQIATVSYRSGPEWQQRFGRKRQVTHRIPKPTEFDFEVESYLAKMGKKFAHYDPNSTLYISKAMDLFDLGTPTQINQETDLEAGLARVKASCLILGVKSDILFPVWQQREVAKHLTKIGKAPITYYELDAPYGHDTFLIDVRNVGSALKGHLEYQLVIE